MTRKETPRFALAGGLAAAALMLGGCASYAAPDTEIAQARATLAATTLAAPAPDASADIARSRDKLALAGRWMDARDHGPARWLAEQAEVDAELALAKSAAEGAYRATSYPLPQRPAGKSVLPAL